MFAQLAIYKNLMVGGVILMSVTIVFFYIWNLKSDIEKLNGTVAAVRLELANEKLQSQRYKSELDMQTKEIKDLELNEKRAIAKLKKFQDQPPRVRYKVIYKIREVKSDDCEDIKDTLDSIRSIDYDLL